MRPLFSTLRSRLFLSSTVPVLLFVGAAVVAFVTIQRLLQTLDLEQHSQRVIARAYDLEAKLTRMEAAKRGHHLSGQAAFKQEYETELKGAQDSLAELRALAGADPVHRERLDKLSKLMDSLRKLGELDFNLFARLPASASKWREMIARLKLVPMLELGRQAALQLDALIDTETTQLAERHRMVERATWESFWAISVTVGGTLILALLIPLQLSRTIVRPIDRLRAAAGRLHQGEFTTLTPEGPTEIAKLISHFNAMGLAFSEREALLHTSERRYRGLIGSLSHILWTTDAQGAITTDFAGWQAFTGQDEAAVQGEGWLSAVHADDRARVRQRWRECLARRQPYEDEYRVCRHDGAWRTMSCRGVPILTPKGDVLEWVCTCADVTETKEEEELRKAKEAAEATSRAKSAFLARMSHELRTPLNAIIGMSKMLSTRRFGPLNPKQADYLSDITHAGEHLLNLINDVLDLSKVEAGHMDLFPEPVPVAETVATLLSTLRALAESKALLVTFEPPEPDANLVTDRGRFKQVLFNLASNAIKYTPAQGRLTVRCRWVDDAKRDGTPCPLEHTAGLRIDVSDTGIGIAAEHQASIWEEFRQLNNPGRVPEGTGLGLALTRRLVALLGGEIWLESSEPGKGSTFSFVLPLRLKPAQEDDVPVPVKFHAGNGVNDESRKPVALVIEDHMPTNKLLSDWLLDAGLETSSAFDGASGVEQARRLHPRLILLDLRLPRLDGWQVLAELKSDPQTHDIPVVIITVLEDRQAPGNLDVADWFVKPLEREQFLARLRSACPGLFSPDRPLMALVVDDNAVARAWLRHLLAGEQVEVVEASSGAEALAQLEEQTPDFVLLDLLMPGMDGFAVVEAIRGQERLKSLPILVVTSKDVTQEEWQRLNGHIQAVLRKDRLTPERLAERLRPLGLALPAHVPDSSEPSECRV
jgi:PAS domain S-box-containing protein